MRPSIIILFVGILFGCSDRNFQEEIIGTWEVYHAEIKTELTYVLVESIQEEESKNIGNIYIFDNVGNFTLKSPTYADDFGTYHYLNECECFELENLGIAALPTLRVYVKSTENKDEIFIEAIDDNFGITTLQLKRL